MLRATWLVVVPDVNTIVSPIGNQARRSQGDATLLVGVFFDLVLVTRSVAELLIQKRLYGDGAAVISS